jgi:hypothetical protein
VFDLTFIFLMGVERCVCIFFAVFVVLINQLHQQRVGDGGTFYTHLNIPIYNPSLLSYHPKPPKNFFDLNRTLVFPICPNTHAIPKSINADIGPTSLVLEGRGLTASFGVKGTKTG